MIIDIYVYGEESIWHTRYTVTVKATFATRVDDDA